MTIQDTPVSSDSNLPRTWRWDQDGHAIEGTFVEFDEGPTAYGTKPILVLEVGDERRSVWLLEAALQSRFLDEAQKRPSGDLTPGERVSIQRGEMTTSGAGREYRKFKIAFPDAPQRRAIDILGGLRESAPDAPTDVDIPF